MAKRMLVIDDQQVVLEACHEIFSNAGYDVLTTDSPQEGLKLASSSSFDVILCDWKIPGHDGMSVMEQVARHSPDSTVVMISSSANVDLATEAMKRGALDYVVKPFTPEKIVDVVEQAVRHKATKRKKALGRFQAMLETGQFPLPSFEDKAPHTIAETVARKIGVKKATSHWYAVFVLGVLAGAYIGFGGLLSTTVTFDMAPIFGIGFTKLVAGAVFSVGLMLVVIAGAELFTGNNLMISSVMAREITLRTMIERWAVVYGANFIGSILLALLFYCSGLWRTGDGALGEAAVRIAYGKVTLGFTEALVRAIGCNWLVCLAVWTALAARHTVGKIFAIFFPIMAFVAIGFEHSVANMYFIPTGIFLRNWAEIAAPQAFDPHALGWTTFLLKNLVPVTIGNIIGGGVFVGMSYWSVYLREAKS